MAPVTKNISKGENFDIQKGKRKKRLKEIPLYEPLTNINAMYATESVQRILKPH